MTANGGGSGDEDDGAPADPAPWPASSGADIAAATNNGHPADTDRPRTDHARTDAADCQTADPDRVDGEPPDSDRADTDPADTETPDTLDAVRADLENLSDDVGVLTAAVHKQLTARTDTDSGTTPAPSRPPTQGRGWRTMTAEAAAATWEQLCAFVDWLADRYQLHDTLPGCWYRHGAFVEELHALHLGWVGAYQHLQARPTEPLTWHDHLHRTLTRLRDWDTLGCIAGAHRDPRPQPADDPNSSAAVRAAYIDADVHRRPAAAAAHQPAAEPGDNEPQTPVGTATGTKPGPAPGTPTLHSAPSTAPIQAPEVR